MLILKHTAAVNHASLITREHGSVLKFLQQLVKSFGRLAHHASELCWCHGLAINRKVPVPIRLMGNADELYPKASGCQ